MSADINSIVSEQRVCLSESAAAKVRELVAKDADGPSMLRVYVTGGGCSGFQYGFKLDREASDDIKVETDGVTMLVDPISFQYLEGAEVDFVSNLIGSQFTVHNPNAQTTCGCGSSFSI